MVFILLMLIIGCVADQSEQLSAKGRVLIELNYLGGAIEDEMNPQLEILENGIARIRESGIVRVLRLPESEAKRLYEFALENGFLELNTDTLTEHTRTLILKKGGPILNIKDASSAEVRVWNGEVYHTVSFHAPRQFLSLAGENPELEVFVALLTKLEAIFSLGTKN